jgi:iron complex outermembrane receptor protein
MKLLYITLFLISTHFVYGQMGTIQGTITSQEGKPAPYITLLVKGTNLGMITDSTGSFKIDRVKPGNHFVQASLVGYDTQTKKIAVAAGEVTVVDFVMTENVNSLQEVVVNGTAGNYVAEKASSSLRVNADLIEIPQNIMVSTRQTIVDMGALTKNDMIRSVSGITKTYGNDLDASLLIRGTNATYGTYRNGVGGPIWWNAQEDAAMIERIEFVKGPAGFMLANSEPGGLVNTVTKQPTHQRINEISFGMGSFNLIRGSLDLGGEMSRDGKLTYRLNVGTQHSAQFYKMGNFNRFFVCPALTYDFSKNTSFTIEHNYVKATTAHNSFQQITVNQKYFALPIDMAMNDPNIGNYMGADVYTRANLKHKIANDWNLNVQAAYMSTDWDGMSLYVQGLTPAKDSIIRSSSKSDWTGNLYNMQVFVDGKFNTGHAFEHKVLAGIDYGDGSEGSTYGGDYSEPDRLKLAIKNPSYYLPKDSLRKIPVENIGSWISTNKWQAIYLQDHIKIANKLIVTLAGRFTHLITGQDYNSVDDPAYEIKDNAFTPRLGLTYLFSDKLSVFALYDESFVAQRGAIWGKGRLRPLRGSNTEFGIKGLFFNKQLAMNASFYNIRKNNVGTSDPVHEGFMLETGQITSTGIDFDLVGKIGSNLSVNANYSYTNARITKDKDASLIGIKNNGTPDHTLNAFLKYRITSGALSGLAIGAGSQYMGKRSAVYSGWGSEFGNKSLPTYNIFDASLSYSVQRLTFNLNVYNLTNKKYISNGYYNPTPDEFIYAPGTPLNFRLQTSLRL